MSLYSALRSGISGLSAQSTALAVISDNIANVSTTAYKRGVADFTQMVNGAEPQTPYNAGGVVAATRRLVDVQGSLEQSRSSTHFAIMGDGFFVVSDRPGAIDQGGSAFFTRSGAFSVDANGNLVNAQGYFLQAWRVEPDGSTQPDATGLSSLEAVNVSGLGSIAEATSTVTMTANLSSSQTAYNTPPVVGAPAYTTGALASGAITPHFSTTLEVFDSLGAARSLNVNFLKVAPNQWAFEVAASPAGSVDATAHPNGLITSGLMNFNADGSVASVTDQAAPPAAFGPLAIDWDASTGATNQTVALNLQSGLTQLAIPSSVRSVTVDGVQPGDLVSLSLEGAGLLTAQFSNGRSRALYQMALATFPSPNNLSAALDPARGGAYRSSLLSGQYSINPMGSGGAGQIQSGALETSNVDLASEFTTLITTQRAYSASSRIITTADQMLEELLSLKR